MLVLEPEESFILETLLVENLVLENGIKLSDED